MSFFHRSKGKNKVSVKEFGDVMAQLLIFRIKDEELKKDAETFYVELNNDDDYHLFVSAMFNFYMWLVDYTSAKALNNKDKWNQCMDRFHWFVYDHYSEIGFITANFQDWYIETRATCSQFDNAVNKEPQVGELWAVAQVLSRHLFGQVQKDRVILTAIADKAKTVISDYEKMMQEFQVE
ncbi:MAG: hypothetical protein ACLFPU_04825 [Dehalococcoidia bacterium]